MLSESQERENHHLNVFNRCLQGISVTQGMATIEVARIWIETLDQTEAMKKVKGACLSFSNVKSLSLLLLLHPKDLCSP